MHYHSDPQFKILGHATQRWAATLSLVLAGLSFHALAAADEPCPDGKPADGIERVGNSGKCLSLRWFEPAGTANAKVRVVFLPGTSSGRAAIEDGSTALALSQSLNLPVVAIQAGEPSPEPYTMARIDFVAATLAQLRGRKPGKKILLIGHGGGAAIAALLASRYPASADAWLLAACPCDLPRWRQASKAPVNAGVELSPQADLGRIASGTRMGVVVGNRDDNAVPSLSEAYVAGLQARGVKTRLTYAMGATHISVLRAPEFFMLAQTLADELSR